jgi:hypothetical protein
MFLDILILKIIFKNYYFHIFLNKKYFNITTPKIYTSITSFCDWTEEQDMLSPFLSKNL